MGKQSQQPTFELLNVDPMTVVIVMRGHVTMAQFDSFIELVDTILSRPLVPKVVVADLLELQWLEPGFAGRVLQTFGARDDRAPISVTVTRSAMLAATARAASVIMRGHRVGVANTRSDGIALGRAMLEEITPREAKPKKVRAVTGEQQRVVVPFKKKQSA